MHVVYPLYPGIYCWYI